MKSTESLHDSKGLLIVIDGIDGCGKTTQVAALRDRLSSAGFGCVASREPTGGKWGQMLRESAISGRFDPRKEMEVILNDRREDVDNCVLPALRNGLVIVLDRYYTSSLAYQSIRGLDEKEIMSLNEEFPVPDLIFLLQIDPFEAQKRIVERDGAPDSFENLDEQTQIAARFDELTLDGICRLDATLPPKHLEAMIYRTVCRRLLSGDGALPQSPKCPEIDGFPPKLKEYPVTRSETISSACEHYGAFTLATHAVSLPLLQKVTEEARKFFTLPVEEKMRSNMPGRGRGYIPVGRERLSSTIGDYGPSDLKESLNIGPDDGQNPPLESHVALGESLRALYDSFNEFAETLFDQFASDLDVCPDFFQEFITNPKAILRLTHYPKIDHPLEVGQLRATPHTDYGCFTILFPDHEVGGLQIYLPNWHWVNVIPPANGVVIHVGDIMERWTNGKYTSPLHRVIVPKDSGYENYSRLSIVFLHNPNPDAIIEPLASCGKKGLPNAFPRMRADEHLKSKSIASRNHSPVPPSNKS